jgi:predicted ATPase
MLKLVERKSELAAVRSLMRRGGLLIVDGGAGLGKTTMVNAACAMARRERRLVLRARGSDLERPFAFGVVRQLFERACADAAEDMRTALFAGAAHAVRALLVPTVANDGGHGTLAVLHGLYWFTMNIAARQPILIVVDDAHWADDASLRWLAYLAPRLQGPRIAVIVALRPNEPQSQTREVAAMRAAALSTISLALLSERAVAKIAREILSADADDELCAAIHRATGGNPFYVFELLLALERSGDPPERQQSRGHWTAAASRASHCSSARACAL